MDTPQEHNRLMELVGLLREGELDAESMRELEAIMQNDPAALDYYVESVDLYSMLHRQHGDVKESVDSVPPNPQAPVDRVGKRRSLGTAAWLAMAMSVSLIVGAGIDHWFWGNRTTSKSDATEVARRYDPESQEIATLRYASGCRWAAASALRYEGQRLSSESLQLETGIAVVQFDCDVSLVIEGPTRLDLVAVDEALLVKGKAVFRGLTDLDCFTLRTPFSKILDEGTEYAVSVDSSGDVMEIHVFDGRVHYESNDTLTEAVHLDAGQARRVEACGNQKKIPLASADFARGPAAHAKQDNALILSESFSYGGEKLVGQDGGKGWNGGWKRSNKRVQADVAEVVSSHAIAWPGATTASDRGSVLLSGTTSLTRSLEKPIRMDRDVAYYVSFLVRKPDLQRSKPSSGWAFITLHDPTGNKIAISPCGRMGTPKLIHNGRTAKTTKSLRESDSQLIVCKISAHRKKVDQVFARVYEFGTAVDSVEPLAWSMGTRPILDNSVFDEIRLVSNESDPVQIGDIRIGKTWGSVTSGYIE
ncbi:FecR protein [Planctomycetes bacterium CA13]|uniref:FecR protein n=1 Tax=Novipirellula herctigrandis TaxID=2527986 RepID=A0A5C5Z060_9BACT|nr:FecR protein [Planctomycetes bacterium CA13]